jgi:clan AA aspartic protease (TIGR02281 family)
MNKKLVLILLFILIFTGNIYNFAGIGENITIDIYKYSLETYYTNVNIYGVGKIRMMVDTGAGYTTINEVILLRLIEQDKTQYDSNLIGIMADGREVNVPLYLVTMQIGRCVLQNVEVAVFPYNTRTLLGLSVLNRFPSFNFDMKNSVLVFPRCPN